ncbi:MAG: hypothetical protein OXG09_01285 [Chloroflexi bacterium]|nr:hypothetical protein [Chloroflexota bacterium]
MLPYAFRIGRSQKERPLILSRRRQQPNLPEETLRRARQAAGLLPEEEEAPEAAAASAEAEEALADEATAGESGAAGAASATSGAQVEAEAASRAAQRAARRRQRLERVSQADARSDALDADTIAERLRQPTRVVAESELRADYAYVLRDLRSMAILAAVLVAALFLLAFVWGM